MDWQTFFQVCQSFFLEKLARIKNNLYLCIAFEKDTQSNETGCSAVRLAHLLWEQGVVGSNPATPTTKRGHHKLFEMTSFYFSQIKLFWVKDRGST